MNLKELSANQQKEYKVDVFEYQMLNEFTEKILQDIEKVRTAVKTSTRQYILSHEMISSIREIIQTLTASYSKESDDADVTISRYSNAVTLHKKTQDQDKIQDQAGQKAEKPMDKNISG
jgi:hypothetical protein